VTPDQWTLLITAIGTVISKIGTTPIALLVLSLFLSPWLILVLVSIAQHRRFEAVVKMYEHNFTQTEGIRVLTEGYSEMTKGYRELVQWTTAEVTEAKEVALNNMHCPIVRKHARPKDIPNE
jgi:hypothetical protein